MKLKIKQFKKGFTLIEVAVAISIFTLIMTIGMGSLVTLSGSYKQAQVEKEVMDILGFTMESMARDIRVGTNYSCYSGSLAGCPNGKNQIFFDASDGRGRFRYYLNSGIIYRNIGGKIQALTSTDKMTIDSIVFRVIGVGLSGPDRLKQPFVVINVKGTTALNGKEFVIQTAVSQRQTEKQSLIII